MSIGRKYLLAYFVSSLRYSWFWLGIWVFYYLRFTNYAGIGLVESITILAATAAEIPTGAVADLFGRKPTMILAFLLMGVGNVIMGMATSLNWIIASVIVQTLGGALASGTMEAFIFDSLKNEGQEHLYNKVFANTNTFHLIVMALTGVAGGFLYSVSPSLPFYASAIFLVLGAGLSLFLKEPVIDQVKFSLANFLNQNKEGLMQLFKNTEVKRQTWALLSVSIFFVISYEMLNDVVAVEFGFNGIQLSILYGVVVLISAAVSQLTPRFQQKFKGMTAPFLLGIFIALTYIVSPVAGLIFGGVSIAFRVSFESMYQNVVSVLINKEVESRYRATALSSFNMLKSIPYVFMAVFLGSLMDRFTAKNFAGVMAVVMLVVIGVQMVVKKPSSSLPQ